MKKIGRTIVKYVVIIVVLLVLTYVSFVSYQNKTKLDYAANVDKVAVTVDGKDLTLKDLSFYVLHQEYVVERQAQVYNADNTRDFWNIHTNGYFLRGVAKKAVMGAAVHDQIFCQEALKHHMVLSSDEKDQLEDARTDFWDDLYDEQKQNNPSDDASVNEIIGHIALAEKYQRYLVKKHQTTYASYNWDGYDYTKLLKQHDVDEKSIWHRVVLGDITLRHHAVNYINGQSDE